MNTAHKPLVRIENWCRTASDQLTGEVYGHPRFEDGTAVMTSLIVKDEDGIVETRNTRYKLGVPAGGG